MQKQHICLLVLALTAIGIFGYISYFFDSLDAEVNLSQLEEISDKCVIDSVNDHVSAQVLRNIDLYIIKSSCAKQISDKKKAIADEKIRQQQESFLRQ